MGVERGFMRGLVCVLTVGCSQAFLMTGPRGLRASVQLERVRQTPYMTAGSIKLSKPSQDELSKLSLLGNTDNIWLPTEVNGGETFSEQLQQDVTRFISEGNGTVIVGGKTFPVSAGTLVTVTQGPALLEWQAGKGSSLTLLISEYWSPARVAARAAVPVVWAGLAVVAIVVSLSSSSSTGF